jgi:hypothetical protein
MNIINLYIFLEKHFTKVSVIVNKRKTTFHKAFKHFTKDGPTFYNYLSTFHKPQNYPQTHFTKDYNISQRIKTSYKYLSTFNNYLSTFHKTQNYPQKHFTKVFNI